MTPQEFRTVEQSALVYEGPVAGPGFHNTGRIMAREYRWTTGSVDVEVAHINHEKDPRAIGVFLVGSRSENGQIGWVPREWTRVLHLAWSEGASLTAQVVPNDPRSSNPREWFTLRVERRGGLKPKKAKPRTRVKLGPPPKRPFGRTFLKLLK